MAESIIEAKRRYREPYIVVAGDFNQWGIAATLADFNEVKEADVGPTRNAATIDWVFVSFGDRLTDAGTVSPLEVDPGEPGAPSDHRVGLGLGLGFYFGYIWLIHVLSISTTSTYQFTYTHGQENFITEGITPGPCKVCYFPIA